MVLLVLALMEFFVDSRLDGLDLLVCVRCYSDETLVEVTQFDFLHPKFSIIQHAIKHLMV